MTSLPLFEPHEKYKNINTIEVAQPKDGSNSLNLNMVIWYNNDYTRTVSVQLLQKLHRDKVTAKRSRFHASVHYKKIRMFTKVIGANKEYYKAVSTNLDLQL